MITHITQEWVNFFITGAGVSGALAGLVMVSISVNLQSILKYPNLPAYAGATISTLVLVLVSSMAGLIDQGTVMLGIEIFFFGLCAWFLQIWFAWISIIASIQRLRPFLETASHIGSGQLQTLPFIIGGILLFAGHTYGLYWISAGVLAVLIFSVLNAWVLLVEILR
jgi:hypothetical protein